MSWLNNRHPFGKFRGLSHYPIHILINILFSDVEPCAFIHYSNVNIHEASLLEALQSPLFKEYRKGQPFNHNHLRPCPLLDNPEKLASMVKKSNAKSRDMESPEDVDVLCAKTVSPAKNWSEIADQLWDTRIYMEK